MNPVASKALFESQVGAIPRQLLAMRRWELVTVAHPLLEVVFHEDGKRSTLFRLVCDGWNELPPSVEMLAPNGSPLPTPLQGGIFNSSLHPTTRKPFICMAGTREYHTHPSHLTDHWDNYRPRPEYDLGGLLSQYWSGWRKVSP